MSSRRITKSKARYERRRADQRELVNALLAQSPGDWKRPEPKSEAVRDGQGFIRVENKDDDRAEVVIYDEISFWGVEPASVLDALKGLKAKQIDLRINSPGGFVYDGITIYRILRNHAEQNGVTVTTHVDGMAASIASVIAQAGDEVVMHAGSRMMIHDPWVLAVGNAADMREEAALLDAVKEDILDVYLEGMPETADRKEISELMTAETWMSADEAIENGFADRKGAEVKTKDDDKEEATAAEDRVKMLRRRLALIASE